MKIEEEVIHQHAVGPISIYKIYQEGYQDRELDDLDAFRRKATKDILCALIIHCSLAREDGARIAIEYTDELIKQLKEE